MEPSCEQVTSRFFQVPVDYDKPGAIRRAIVMAEFDDVQSVLSDDAIPLVSHGKFLQKVSVVNLNEQLKKEEVVSRLGSLGLISADPLTTFNFVFYCRYEMEGCYFITYFVDEHGREFGIRIDAIFGDTCTLKIYRTCSRAIERAATSFLAVPIK